jgi:hypothetical protein
MAGVGRSQTYADSIFFSADFRDKVSPSSIQADTLADKKLHAFRAAVLFQIKR